METCFTIRVSPDKQIMLSVKSFTDNFSSTQTFTLESSDQVNELLDKAYSNARDYLERKTKTEQYLVENPLNPNHWKGQEYQGN